MTAHPLEKLVETPAALDEPSGVRCPNFKLAPVDVAEMPESRQGKFEIWALREACWNRGYAERHGGRSLQILADFCRERPPCRSAPWSEIVPSSVEKRRVLLG